MARWADGYMTDLVYTDNVYREMTPAWLALAALLLGQRPPDLSRPFRYADLGCGLGMNAIVVAATCPHAEVWGFDLNPAHVEEARRWAAEAGLSNITFEETSFADLAGRAPASLPAFDFMVSHGVMSWVSPANQRHLIDVIGQRLQPGGLAYVSYNVLTGWASMVPIRALMRMLAAARPERSDLAMPGLLDMLDRLAKAGARYFPANPGVAERLTALRGQDGRYLAHEYLNADWHPLMCADVIDALAEARCSYLGSATLAEDFDVTSVPPDMIPLLAETHDLPLRETLRDLGAARGFRRDLYRRGLVQLAQPEQISLLEALWFTAAAALPDGEVTFTTPIGTLSGRPEIYQPLLAVLRAGPADLTALRQAEPARPMGELVQALALLTHGGFIHPMLPHPEAGRAGAQALNQRIAHANDMGLAMPQLVAPAIGSVLAADVLETIVVGRLLAGAAPDAASLAADAVALLHRSGRTLQRDGHPIEEPEALRQHATELVRALLGPRAALLRSLGVLPA